MRFTGSSAPNETISGCAGALSVWMVRRQASSRYSKPDSLTTRSTPSFWTADHYGCPDMDQTHIESRFSRSSGTSFPVARVAKGELSRNGANPHKRVSLWHVQALRADHDPATRPSGSTCARRKNPSGRRCDRNGATVSTRPKRQASKWSGRQKRPTYPI